MNCKYCFEKNSMNGKGFNDFKSLLYFLKKLPLSQECNIKFIGGEPMIKYDTILDAIKILSKIERYKDTHITFGMTTNGSFDKELLSLLDEKLVSPELIHLSWDGYGDKNNIHILDTMLPYKDKITIRVPVSIDTVNSLYNTFYTLLSKGYTVLEYYYLNDYEYDNSLFPYLFSRQLKKIIELDPIYTLVNLDSFYLSPYIKNIHDAIRCRHIGRQLYINEYGELYPCGMFSDAYKNCTAGGYKIGDIYNGFDRIILGEFIDDFSSIPSCSCTNSQCFECPAVSYYNTGNMQKKMMKTCELKSIEYRLLSSILDKMPQSKLDWNAIADSIPIDISYDIPTSLPYYN